MFDAAGISRGMMQQGGAAWDDGMMHGGGLGMMDHPGSMGFGTGDVHHIVHPYELRCCSGFRFTLTRGFVLPLSAVCLCWLVYNVRSKVMTSQLLMR